MAADLAVPHLRTCAECGAQLAVHSMGPVPAVYTCITCLVAQQGDVAVPRARPQLRAVPAPPPVDEARVRADSFYDLIASTLPPGCPHCGAPAAASAQAPFGGAGARVCSGCGRLYVRP